MKSISEKKIIVSWAFYDWANSAFATTIMAAVLPVYFSTVAAAELDPTIASSYWGYANTAAMILIAFMAPILGAIADHRNRKKSSLIVFLGIGVVSTGLLYFSQAGLWLATLILYVFGRIGYSGANLFYDSLLPGISKNDELDQVSTLGYAMGYVGGGLLLAVNLLMILKYDLFGIADSETGTRLSFFTVSVWWLVFSIPLIKNVPEPQIKGMTEGGPNAIKAGFARLQKTFRDIKKFKQAFLFLISFFLYNDGIGTIIVMAVIFGAEIGIAQEHLIGAILMVQFVGIPFTLLFGKLASKLSAKTAIYIGLFSYMLISAGGYFLQTPLHFWLLAIFVGMVQGGTQALSRSVFASMIPKTKAAEFFGFFDISQKFSGILGPAIFGIVAQLFASSRFSIVALVIFFISGIAVLSKVNIREGIEVAMKYETGKL